MALVPPTAELAAIWRREVFLACGWSECRNQAGVLGDVREGEAGGLFVTTDRWPASEERACSVSLVMYPRQFSWEQIRQLAQAGPPGTELLRERLPRAAAHGIAFDTWVGQTDHDDHPHNIVFGYHRAGEGARASLDGDYVFLDFAMALGWGGAWDAGSSALGVAPFPPVMAEAIDMPSLGGILDRIEAVPDDTIAEIVHRIPDDYLVPEQRDAIARGLRARREATRALLAPMVGGRS